jgi:hypothetical protein
LTRLCGQLESHSESPLHERRGYKHSESRQWQCLVIRRRPSDGQPTWTQGQGRIIQEQTTSMLGPSAATATKLRSTGSRDTRASPGTKTLTTRQTKHEMTEDTLYASRYTLRPIIELEGSPKRERRQWRSGRPISAPYTTDID